MFKEGYENVFDKLNNAVSLCSNFQLVWVPRAGVDDPNVRVVTNFMDSDEHGVFEGLKGELFHEFNKPGGALSNKDHLNQL